MAAVQSAITSDSKIHYAVPVGDSAFILEECCSPQAKQPSFMNCNPTFTLIVELVAVWPGLCQTFSNPELSCLHQAPTLVNHCIDIAVSTSHLCFNIFFLKVVLTKGQKNTTAVGLNDLSPWQHLCIDRASLHLLFMSLHSPFALTFPQQSVFTLSILGRAFHLSVVFCHRDWCLVGLC